ncbi:hypothetical protein HMPREF0580_2079 [Mobiluncus mulieris ATCC 35239]|uniref:Uncharacterized protein n=1 Tax=Mobiluncus mulieris ATCC 35239 TaxID=871571 RepID=E0QT64_9ACTO|nr:hypothetical protein HMPREF0577_1440 [Mobiluncus mulieris ATCC 35243]EFM45190.1 hypothetical protein HMPREF0580_2079 [Mobiluncus mulieris ATCC 35239]
MELGALNMVLLIRLYLMFVSLFLCMITGTEWQQKLLLALPYLEDSLTNWVAQPVN